MRVLSRSIFGNANQIWEKCLSIQSKLRGEVLIPTTISYRLLKERLGVHKQKIKIIGMRGDSVLRQMANGQPAEVMAASPVLPDKLKILLRSERWGGQQRSPILSR